MYSYFLFWLFLTAHMWGRCEVWGRYPVLAHNDQFSTFCWCFRSQPSRTSSHHCFAWSRSTNERPVWGSAEKSQPMRDGWFLLPDVTNSPHLRLGPKYGLNKQNRSVLIFKISSGSPEYFKYRSFFNCWESFKCRNETVQSTVHNGPSEEFRMPFCPSSQPTWWRDGSKSTLNRAYI